MTKENNIQVFFALVRAGLWERDVELRKYGVVVFPEILRLAKEQSVVGLVSAGLEHVTDTKVPQTVALSMAGEVLQIEQRNKALNQFTVSLLKKMEKAGIESILIKGQGIAQCYERPLWRSSGDVDLLLNHENYEKGKAFLNKKAEFKAKEYDFNKEYNTSIEGWCVELHGSLRCGLSPKLNKEVEKIQNSICDNHRVRYWGNNGMEILLPEENEDALVIFTHFIKHFYKGGLGIRQVCDWCRLLWTYRDSLNCKLLESRLKHMGLMAQWKGFGAFAVNYLGMPSEAMPFYSSDKKWSRKADKISIFMMEVGNFGHNVDSSYYSKYPLLVRKAISMGRLIKTLVKHAKIFPTHSIRFLPHVIYTGMKATLENGTGYKK